MVQDILALGAGHRGGPEESEARQTSEIVLHAKTKTRHWLRRQHRAAIPASTGHVEDVIFQRPVSIISFVLWCTCCPRWWASQSAQEMTDGDGGTTSRCLLSVSFIFSLDTCSVQEALYVTRLYLVIAYGVHPRRPISSLGLLCLSQVLTMTTRSLSPPSLPQSTFSGDRRWQQKLSKYRTSYVSILIFCRPDQAQASPSTHTVI